MEIISEELVQRGIILPPETEAVVKRVIHTTADFDCADNLRFSDHAVPGAVEAFRNGASVITDTNIARAGISKAALTKQGGEVYCYMANSRVAAAVCNALLYTALGAIDPAERQEKLR